MKFNHFDDQVNLLHDLCLAFLRVKENQNIFYRAMHIFTAGNKTFSQSESGGQWMILQSLR